MSVKIFLSVVSDEFRSYRDQLRTDLTRHNVEVAVQEDFKDYGVARLDKLDLYISTCDEVIHLVGDMSGVDAKPASTTAIVTKYPDIAEKLPPLREPFDKGLGISYTQWEAWLALYHGKALLIAKADDAAPRGPNYNPTDVSRTAQQMHLQRLSEIERYPGFTFTSPDNLAKQIAYTTILDLLAQDQRGGPPVRLPKLRRLLRPLIFLAYRREDTKGITGRIFDRLQSHFGKTSVFIDVETILPGLDFRQHIERTLDRCDVLVAIIGPHWTGADASNQPRIFEPNDWVRTEIEIALSKRIPVIPVLVDRTPMPAAHDLPQSLRPITYFQEARLDSGRDFDVHMRRLIRAVARYLGWRALVFRYGSPVGLATIILFTILFTGYFISREFLAEKTDSEFSRPPSLNSVVQYRVHVALRARRRRIWIERGPCWSETMQES